MNTPPSLPLKQWNPDGMHLQLRTTRGLWGAYFSNPDKDEMLIAPARMRDWFIVGYRLRRGGKNERAYLCIHALELADLFGLNFHRRETYESHYGSRDREMLTLGVSGCNTGFPVYIWPHIRECMRLLLFFSP